VAVGRSHVRQSVVVGHQFWVPFPPTGDWGTPGSELMTNDRRLGTHNWPARRRVAEPLYRDDKDSSPPARNDNHT